MFANRLRKNLKNLGRWAQREGIDCFRLYDADMPEYAVAIDLYQGDRLWAHCQEYAPPPSVDTESAERRLAEIRETVPAVLRIPREQVFFKVRRRQRGGTQYHKLALRRQMHEVREGPCTFLVNFTDYLDTGLFLDHRPIRALVGQLAAGKRFLNLFAYTGTASVYAALGGAETTTTVDLSKTYLDWARRNLERNGMLGARHRLLQADCLEWLERQSEARKDPGYGLIFLDPPTFSRSKRMHKAFDVQRDHAPMLRHAVRLLEPDGLLIFSNNYRRFRMDPSILQQFAVEDISRQTVPRDFARNPRIHNCWLIRRRSRSGG